MYVKKLKICLFREHLQMTYKAFINNIFYFKLINSKHEYCVGMSNRVTFYIILKIHVSYFWHCNLYKCINKTTTDKILA